jgi:hypothetical protein
MIAYSIAAYVSIKKRIKRNDLGRTNHVDTDRVSVRFRDNSYSIHDVQIEEQNYN